MKSMAFFGLTGQGIETAGDILMAVLQRQGYAHRAWRDFSTIIRGGYTAYEIYIADEGEESPPPRLKTVDIAVVWDDEGSKRYLPRLREKHLLFGSTHASLTPSQNQGDAPKLGFNVWGLGVLAGFLGIPFELVEAEVTSRFRGAANQEYAREGYKLGEVNSSSVMKAVSREHVNISGNDALSLGAIAGGVRHYFGYPITPASEILENLAQWLPALGGGSYQVEDEIAAIHAAVGCSFSGKRTLVASSGPGISLMTEGLGYAAATEIPIVIVDNQRGGPSTGMPTKTEQSDLFHLRSAGHGEFGRILLSPTDVTDCAIVIQEALNLADYYQCPVILALDLDLALRRISIPWSTVEAALSSVDIDRGPTLTRAEPLENYVRYQPAADGGPPLRTIPGIPGGAYVASGDEHDERGYMEPDFQEVRPTLHKRRVHKTDRIHYQRPFSLIGDPGAPCTLIGTGAFGELIRHVVQRHPEHYQGLLLRQLYPLPVEELCNALENTNEVIVAEYNARGQIRSFVEQALEQKKIHSLLRYDGEHYTLEDFESRLKELSRVH